MKKKKTNLLLLEMSVEEFIGEVCRQIELIREHHFTWKSQANFLKELNSDLKENEVLILLNFVENYSFVVYDAVQCYHWNNSQATLHLFIAHYLNANTPVLNFFVWFLTRWNIITLLCMNSWVSFFPKSNKFC